MKRYIITFLFIVLIFNGFGSIRELTDLAIVKSMGIDIDENGEYEISAIVIDTSEQEKKDKGIIYTAKGKSVHEAARNIVGKSPKKLYIAHMESLIISEQVAKECFENTLDFFIRDNEGGNSFYIFISNVGSAKEIVEKINKEEINLVSFLNSTNKYKGNANTKNLNDILKCIIEKGKDFCINTVSIEDDDLIINNMAYFKGMTLGGNLTEQESILFNMLTNNTENLVTSIGEGDDLVVAELIYPKTDISLKDNENVINIKVDISANITQIGKNITIDTIENQKEIEKIFEEKIKNEIESFYFKLKDEYKSDIIGVGNLLYRKKSDLFNNENYLDILHVNVGVKMNILGQGGVNKI